MTNYQKIYLEEQIGELDNLKNDFVLLVEDEADKIFWNQVFKTLKYKFKAYVSAFHKSKKDNLTKGKAIVLQYHKFANDYPNKLKFAVDSDFDFLLENGNLRNSNQILRSDFNIQNHILQTYTHSIENYFCYSNSLENLCLQETKSERNSVFDFEKFLKEYSKIIYPLFILYLLFEENKFDNLFSNSDFNESISIDYQLVAIENLFSKLESLKEKVAKKIEELKENFTENDFKKMKTQIETKGVSAENCYLFIQGHFLFDKVVKPIFKNITSQLSKEVGENFEGDDKQSYFKNVKKAKQMLYSNYNFYNIPIFQKLKNDVAILESSLKTQH